MNYGSACSTSSTFTKDLQVQCESEHRALFPHNVTFTVLSIAGLSIGLWRTLLYLVTPIMVLKQIISFVHLYTAAVDLAAIDEAERSDKAKTQ